MSLTYITDYRRYLYRLHYVKRKSGEIVATRIYHTLYPMLAVVNQQKNEYENGVACWIEWLQVYPVEDFAP